MVVSVSCCFIGLFRRRRRRLFATKVVFYPKRANIPKELIKFARPFVRSAGRFNLSRFAKVCSVD